MFRLVNGHREINIYFYTFIFSQINFSLSETNLNSFETLYVKNWLDNYTPNKLKQAQIFFSLKHISLIRNV